MYRSLLSLDLDAKFREVFKKGTGVGNVSILYWRKETSTSGQQHKHLGINPEGKLA